MDPIWYPIIIVGLFNALIDALSTNLNPFFRILGGLTIAYTIFYVIPAVLK